MSIRWMTDVWDRAKDVKGTPLLVLLCLADHAQDETGEAWPSIARIAQRTRVSERAVQMALVGLEAKGYLGREMRRGRSTVYHLVPLEGGAAGFAPEESAPPKNLHPGGEAAFTTGVQQASPITVIEPPSEPSLVEVAGETTSGRALTQCQFPAEQQRLLSQKFGVINGEVWESAWRTANSMTGPEFDPSGHLASYLGRCIEQKRDVSASTWLRFYVEDKAKFVQKMKDEQGTDDEDVNVRAMRMIRQQQQQGVGA